MPLNFDSLKPTAIEAAEAVLRELEGLSGALWGTLDARQLGVLREAIVAIVENGLLSWIDKGERVRHMRNVSTAINILESESAIAQMKTQGLIRAAFSRALLAGAGIALDLLK